MPYPLFEPSHIYFRLGRPMVLCLLLLASGCNRDSSTSTAFPNLKVPAGFTIEPAVPEGMVKYPMFATLDSTGRLFVIESSGSTTSTEDVLKNPTFFIRRLEDSNDDGVYDQSVIFADRLPYPMGGTFYRGSFYVAAPPDFLKLTDADGDGVAEKREVILTGWTLSHNAATLSGPFRGPDGWMYMCDARRGFDITTKEGERLKGRSARIWRCRPDGTGLESVSGGGFDNTIELIFMPGGETIGTMTYFTDPQDGQRDALMHWVEGGVYPKPYSVIEEDNLKLTGDLMPVMTKLARISHAGIMRYRGSSFGDEYTGNLFTAEFNTGRIMRYVVTTDGATFKTENEPFMTSEAPDFHPTDVLEDADGSLLLVNTGGWFIAGCPLSVEAKTDIHGNIFRIRKTDNQTTSDPWGKRMDLHQMSMEDLAELANDVRPAVRDNVFEEFVVRGQSAVSTLKAIGISNKEEEVRAAAIFALYRIGTAPALDAALGGLQDKHVIVRTATCRIAGLARAGQSVDRLVHILQNDEPQAQRQAATALGQIGDKTATGALLAAAENVNDRFVEHAIIYALIGINNTGMLVEALARGPENTQRAALIALDQGSTEQLQKQQLKTYLDKYQPRLTTTAVWVLTHHPEWSDLAEAYLNRYFYSADSTGAQKNLVTDLITTFSGTRDVQRWIARQLYAKGVTEDQKLELLKVMSETSGGEFPTMWLPALERLLADKRPAIQAAVIDLIATRQLTGMEKQLTDFAASENVDEAFRMKALSARVASSPDLSDREFNMLTNFIDSTHETTVRQSAVRLLGQSRPNEKQLVSLARDHLPDAEDFLLAGLVSAFDDSKDEGSALMLLSTLSKFPAERLGYLSIAELERILSTMPAKATQHAAEVLQRMKQGQAARLSELNSLEATLDPGDVGEGRRLFYGKALCSTCHAVAANGRTFGPDLTNIGQIRGRHDLLEAIIYPDASFAREYESWRIQTVSNTYVGVIKEQFPETIVIETAPDTRVTITRSEVRNIEPEQRSLMPSGLHKQLSPGELNDLMAFLTTLPDGLGHLRKNTNKPD